MVTAKVRHPAGATVNTQSPVPFTSRNRVDWDEAGAGEELPGSCLSGGQQDPAYRPVGSGLMTAPRARDRAGLGEGPSPGLWSRESGDRTSAPAQGRQGSAPPQALTPLLTSSLLILVLTHHSIPLRCLTGTSQETESFTGGGTQRGPFGQGLVVTKASNSDF